MDGFHHVAAYDITIILVSLAELTILFDGNVLLGSSQWLTSVEWPGTGEVRYTTLQCWSRLTIEKDLPFGFVFISFSFCSITIMNQTSYNFFLKTILKLNFPTISPFHNFPSMHFIFNVCTQYTNYNYVPVNLSNLKAVEFF